MIDLRNAELPNALEVDGELYEIDTDFRTWIRFNFDYENGIVPFYIFKKSVPEASYEAQAAQFLYNPNVTPRNTETTSERLLHYVIDGEYIVASFQAVYGIDLTDPKLKMHWHRFKALLDGLPENSKLGTIMSYRGWKKSNLKHETVMQRQKEAWKLPLRIDPDTFEDLDMREAQRIAEAMYERQVNNE